MDGKSYAVAPGSRHVLSAIGLMLVGGAVAIGVAGYHGWGVKSPSDYWDMWYLSELRRINMHYRDGPGIRAWVARHLKPFDAMKFSAETARRG